MHNLLRQRQNSRQSKRKSHRPFKRPSDISNDHSTDVERLKNALKYIQEEERFAPSHILILRPTSPIRSLKLATEAMEMTLNYDMSVRSACKIPDKMSPNWAISKNDNAYSTFTRDGFLTRSQDISQYFYPTGSYDLIHVENFLISEELYGKEFMIIEDQNEFINDIDYQHDLDALNTNYHKLVSQPT